MRANEATSKAVDCIAAAASRPPVDRIVVREVAHGHAHTCVPDDNATIALQTTSTLASIRERRRPAATAMAA
jgi:hypothetical protein